MKYENIERERMRNNWSKQEFAALLGITEKTYNNWQRYGNIPSSKLLVMATAFRCSIDYLLNMNKAS